MPSLVMLAVVKFGILRLRVKKPSRMVSHWASCGEWVVYCASLIKRVVVISEFPMVRTMYAPGARPSRPMCN